MLFSQFSLSVIFYHDRTDRFLQVEQGSRPHEILVSQCFSYHKRDDAPLCRLPFKAAVDVSPVADQNHDAPLYTVKVLLEQLKDTEVHVKEYCKCLYLLSLSLKTIIRPTIKSTQYRTTALEKREALAIHHTCLETFGSSSMYFCSAGTTVLKAALTWRGKHTQIILPCNKVQTFQHHTLTQTTLTVL